MPSAIVRFQFLYGAIITKNLRHLQNLFRVSIPLWCDYNYLVIRHLAASILFQFLYGAIITVRHLVQYGGRHRFNSSMVRL